MVVFETPSRTKRQIDPTHIIVAATVFVVLVILISYTVLFHTRDAKTANSIFGISLLCMSLAGFGLYQMRKLAQQAAEWSDTAASLGLACKTVGHPWRRQVVIEGRCRGRFVRMSISHDTPGRVPVTCVDMDLVQPTDAKFRIWGPFTEDEVMEYSHRRDFRKAKRFGTHKSYFAFANSPHLSANLMPPNIWQRLQANDYPINISLVDQTLSLEQPGITRDSAELIAYVEILNEIAYIISEWEVQWRQQTPISQMPLAPA